MLILFDQSAPAPLRRHLPGHRVVLAKELGWERLANGVLLDAAEAAAFEVFITADKNLRYQQNLSTRRIAIVVIGNAQWRVLRGHVDRAIEAVKPLRREAISKSKYRSRDRHRRACA